MTATFLFVNPCFFLSFSLGFLCFLELLHKKENAKAEFFSHFLFSLSTIFHIPAKKRQKVFLFPTHFLCFQWFVPGLDQYKSP